MKSFLMVLVDYSGKVLEILST